MGGNALSFETRRVEADEYFNLVDEIEEKWHASSSDFSTTDIYAIPSYFNKKDFGDIDFVLPRKPGLDFAKVIKEVYKPREIYSNGGCYSFDYKGVQVDFITTKKEELTTSYEYFAYNDLGNLIGRIAHKMGCKYGHHGLSVLIKDGDYLIKEIQLSRDPREIHEFLGYDFDERANIEELEDIFKYAQSSPFYASSIYQLDNRNAVARIRDKKRKTYTEFLKWIEVNPKADEFPWDLFGDKSQWILSACVWFGKLAEYKEALQQRKKQVELKERFNGDLVSQLTGLREKELGEFMKQFREAFPTEQLFNMSASQIQAEIENFERKVP